MANWEQVVTHVGGLGNFPGTTITAATATTIPTTGDYFYINAAADINSFVVTAGRRFTLEWTAAGDLIDDGANLDLGSAGDIVTAIGDVATFQSGGVNGTTDNDVKLISYLKSDQTPLAGGGSSNATTVTITDNENTNEDNAIIFTSAGDVDGGDIGLESDGTLTYNPSTGKITATGFIGALTGQADTVGTIAGLAPDTATTQATQGAITSAANLVTVGALNSGSITSGFGTINNGSSTITTTGAI